MKILFALIFALISLVSYAQDVDKYKLIQYATVYKDKNGEYVYNTEWLPCNDVATIDVHKLKATFFNGEQELKFDIVTSHPIEDENKDAILRFICVDDAGIKCGITLIGLATSSDKGQQFIKIDYGNKALLYKCDQQK